MKLKVAYFPPILTLCILFLSTSSCDLLSKLFGPKSIAQDGLLSELGEILTSDTDLHLSSEVIYTKSNSTTTNSVETYRTDGTFEILYPTYNTSTQETEYSSNSSKGSYTWDSNTFVLTKNTTAKWNTSSKAWVDFDEDRVELSQAMVVFTERGYYQAFEIASNSFGYSQNTVTANPGFPFFDGTLESSLNYSVNGSTLIGEQLINGNLGANVIDNGRIKLTSTIISVSPEAASIEDLALGEKITWFYQTIKQEESTGDDPLTENTSVGFMPAKLSLLIVRDGWGIDVTNFETMRSLLSNSNSF